MQRGIALAFNKFDEYQFAQYNRPTVKLWDALFLAHPMPKDEQQQGLFNKIVSDTLDVPYTWEVELSALGQQKLEIKESRTMAFKAKWEELIDSRKLGITPQQNSKTQYDVAWKQKRISARLNPAVGKNNCKVINQTQHTWLLGPFGQTRIINHTFVDQLIMDEKLSIQKNQKGFGLLNSLEESNLHENDVSRFNSKISYCIHIKLAMIPAG